MEVRTILFHAQAQWLQGIHTSLWLYAMKTACYISNTLASSSSTQLQLEKFVGVAVSPMPKHTHTHIWLPSF